MPTENAKNRGYYKIEGAVRAFNFDFKNKIVLDIGSSTGGFTELALSLGAAKVIAVEKGTNQMKSPLRHDPRVELHEKTDIFDTRAQKDSSKMGPVTAALSVGAQKNSFEMGPATAALSARAQKNSFEGGPELGKARSSASRPWRRAGWTRPEKEIFCAPDVIVADVSFLSLTKILKYAKIHLARSDTDFLVMLKPQFEAKPYQLNRGVVKNEKYRREIIKNFELWLKQNDFIIIKKRDNDLAGKNGNLERFYWLRLVKKQP